MGDGRRGREKRGILRCSVVFNASNKERKPSKSFFSTKPKLGKISKLFQIRSPFISYGEEEPLKKLEHQVDSHDTSKSFLLKIID